MKHPQTATSVNFRRAAVPELLFGPDLGLVLDLAPQDAEGLVLEQGVPHIVLRGRVAVRREALFRWLAAREVER